VLLLSLSHSPLLFEGQVGERIRVRQPSPPFPESGSWPLGRRQVGSL
jgi:hypothetical protein